jgi:hypothetical protein
MGSVLPAWGAGRRTMRQLSRVTMSMRELDRLKCVQAVIEGELGAGVAAERLGMSTR